MIKCNFCKTEIKNEIKNLKIGRTAKAWDEYGNLFEPKLYKLLECPVCGCQYQIQELLRICDSNGEDLP